jgi:hypothetical protein
MIPARFAALSKGQQLAIAIGLPTALAVALGYMAYGKLAELGPDPDVPAFFHREGDDTIRNGDGSCWQQISRLDGQIQELDAVIRRLDARRQELAGLQKEIATAQEMLPREKDILDIVQKLSEMARQIPSDLGSIKVGAISYKEQNAAAAGRGAAAKSSLPQITFDIELEGDINGIIKYIDSIEKDRRYMAVTNISIKPGKVTSDGQGVAYEPHKAKLSFITYTYTPSKTSGRP